MKIRINAVQCTTPDEIDKDELYLKMHGQKIWPEGQIYHRVDTGDKVDVGLILEVTEGWNEIEVWDFDFISRNDLLGAFRFNVNTVPGQYSTSMTLLEKNSTASYYLFWEVL
ncbi:MAG: hypothetical protein AAF616_04560 [Bacteroidota bacterium]